MRRQVAAVCPSPLPSIANILWRRFLPSVARSHRARRVSRRSLARPLRARPGRVESLSSPAYASYPSSLHSPPLSADTTFSLAHGTEDHTARRSPTQRADPHPARRSPSSRAESIYQKKSLHSIHCSRPIHSVSRLFHASSRSPSPLRLTALQHVVTRPFITSHAPLTKFCFSFATIHHASFTTIHHDLPPLRRESTADSPPTQS